MNLTRSEIKAALIRGWRCDVVAHRNGTFSYRNLRAGTVLARRKRHILSLEMAKAYAMDYIKR
jgi:hypothetical protein